MIKLEQVQFLQTLITYFVVYFPTVSLAGWFEAWLADKFGDSTAKNLGFLTLNPAQHADPLGMAILVLPPHFGFGRRLPINIDNIFPPYKTLKIWLVFFAKAIMHLLLVVFSVFVIVSTEALSIKYLPANLENVSSLFFSFLLIVKALLNLNIISVIIYFVVGLFRAFMVFVVPDIKSRSPMVDLFLFLMPFLMILVLGAYLEIGMSFVLSKIYKLFAYLLIR